MKRYGAMLMAALAGLSLASAASAANVIISEIMYHPSSEDVREEYIELYNVGATNVDLSGWRFSSGIQFTFTNTTVLAPGAYLVVAADEGRFKLKYPSINNVIGNWAGILSNSRQDIDLDDAFGNRADSVEYADEGDWAIRRRGDLDRNHRGWAWLKEHDGYGKSLELINPLVSNNYGQNWASSTVANGTPGRVNSVFQTNIPPMILEAAHLPVIPKSTDAVLVTARIVDERTNNVTATLHWRLDAVTPPPFASLPMFDDGLHEDGAPGDGIFGATIPPQANNAIVELYLEARDQEGNVRTWPGPTVDTDGAVLGQRANLLYQVDDTTYAGLAPLYKLIMTEVERAELDNIGHANSDERNTDAQMNGTFVGIDGNGMQVRYQVGIKNRGHGSRNRQPNNYRVDFTSDRPWKDVIALNINGQYSHAQHVGAVLSQKSGIAGADARAVQVRVNNANLANNGPQTYGGMYVANEVLNSEWAEHWFPDDDSGNAYRALRDIAPSDFAYRGEDKNAYTNTWYKQTNVSEDDWTDLIGMLRIVGTNDLFTTANVRQVVNVEQWMLHLAIMALFNNQETGLNSSYNDDYFFYRGVNDPRFILLFYDLDTIMGEGSASGATDYTIFGATGPGLPAFNRFMHWPEFEPIYYRTLQRLIDTTFSQTEFDATVEQTVGGYVPPSVINRMKTWMNGRRAYVQAQIGPFVPPATNAPVAAVTGEPRSPTPFGTATLTVGGAGVSHYRYKLNNGVFGAETPVGTPIQLSGLPNGGTNTVYVIGRNSAGSWQNDTNATASRTWVVNTSWPAVRINEVLARNVSAVNHNGTFPDLIELYNEGTGTVDLAGMRLTDNPGNPNKYAFPSGATLTGGAYLVLNANNNDGTPGIHLGFSLNQDGEGVYLFQRATDGGALLDSVVFGLQLPDLSIGRFAGGAFALTQPTFDAANVARPTGNFRTLRINEWLTDTLSLFPTDFVELYNPDQLPVAVGGLFLTDNPIGAPRRHEITPLSFIAASGYTAFKADSDPNQGADHLNFKLAVEQGLVALLAQDETVINCVSYGPQRTDVSQGRSPNGSDSLSFFLQPTPGAANPLASANVTTQTVSLLSMTNVWKYNQTANLDGTNWTDPAYTSDSSWPSGAAVLYHDPDPIPVPTNTMLTLGRNTYYFRTHFNYGGDPASAVLMLSLVIDDGAVFYLNGQRLYSVGMPTNGPITYATNANRNVNNADIEGPTIASASDLRVGDNVLAAEVHQISSSSQDIAFGLALTAVTTVTNLSSMPVLLGEVLANNQSITNSSGVTADWIELFNPGNNAIDLGDMSLSDEVDAPRKWVFPANTVIAAGGFVVVSFDGNAPASTNNTGFGLSSGGDAVYFFQKPAAGGALVDSVTFGLQAADFSIGRDVNGGGPWRLSLPTPGTANVAAGLGNPAALRINEWMANPADGDDWFEIYNPNLQPVDLNGLALTDDLTDRDKSPIPALSFIGAGDHGFAKFIADGSTGKGADHVGFGLLSAGDQIGLFTALGSQIDAVNFGVQAPGVSQGRFPDGSGVTANFTATSSPGESNFLPLPNVVINEVLSHTDLPLEDAIEFYNPTAADANIGGWFLSNTGGSLRKFRVPGGTVIPARGFIVIYENQFGTNMGPSSIIPFTFNSAHGDQAYLSQTNGSGGLSGYRARVEFGAAANGVSFGRYSNSIGQQHFVAMSRRSFGADNPSTVQQFREGGGAANPYPLVGPVVINEIMFQPPLLGTNDNTRDEFIELRNISASAVPLYDPAAPTNTWKIKGGVDYTFPQNTALPAGGYLLLVSFNPQADPSALAAFRTRYGLGTNSAILGPYDGQLGNTGENVSLCKPDPPQLPPHPDAGFVPDVVVERIDYLSLAPWPAGAAGTGSSLQRSTGADYGNDPANWFVAAPTALAANTTTASDSDGDGLPDAWELQYFPLISDPDATPYADPDGDGFTNLQEYVAGTNPKVEASKLKIDAVTVAGSEPAVQFSAVAGKTYTVLYRDDLSNGTWLKLRDVPAQAGTGVVTIPDSTIGDGTTRYYRLVTPAQP